jgi:hypothetical protein
VFIQNLLEGGLTPTPSFDWTISNTTGEIVATLNSAGKVFEANVWWAYSCGVNHWDSETKRRDFRVAHLDNPCSCGVFAQGYCTNLKTVWKKAPLDVEMVRGKRVYRAKVDAPEDGSWVAFFIDIKYVNQNPFPPAIAEDLNTNKRETDRFGGFGKDFGRFLEFTTEVSVWPNTFPYEDCSGETCGTRLV